MVHLGRRFFYMSSISFPISFILGGLCCLWINCSFLEKSHHERKSACMQQFILMSDLFSQSQACHSTAGSPHCPCPQAHWLVQLRDPSPGLPASLPAWAPPSPQHHTALCHHPTVSAAPPAGPDLVFTSLQQLHSLLFLSCFMTSTGSHQPCQPHTAPQVQICTVHMTCPL